MRHFGAICAMGLFLGPKDQNPDCKSCLYAYLEHVWSIGCVFGVPTASFEFKNLNFNGYFGPFWAFLGRFGPLWARRALTLTVKVVCMHD